METWLLCGRRLWLRGSAFPSELSLQLLPLSGARTSGGQSWLSRMASTARPSRPWLLMVWLLPLLRCCRRCSPNTPSLPLLPYPLVLCPPPITVSESSVRKGVRSFPNGSAPGPSGLRPSHLREAVGCPSPDRAGHVLASLTSFVNFLAAGRAPSSVVPFITTFQARVILRAMARLKLPSSP